VSSVQHLNWSVVPQSASVAVRCGQLRSVAVISHIAATANVMYKKMDLFRQHQNQPSSLLCPLVKYKSRMVPCNITLKNSKN